jgi:hypothetical protein
MIIILLGMLIFLGFSSLLIYVFIDLLIDKIQRPNFKNLDYSTFTWFGVVIIIFIGLDFLILRRFIKMLKDRE